MVFQNAELLPWRSALDNVALGLEIKGVARRSANGSPATISSWSASAPPRRGGPISCRAA